MTLLRKLLVVFLMLPGWALAGLAAADLPDGIQWYVHADLKQMRESASGRELYKWMDAEVFMEIHDEIGIDINKETDRLTAFSSAGQGTIIVIEGGISKESQDKVLALATLQSKLDTREHKGKTYYHVRDYNGQGRTQRHQHDNEVQFNDFDDQAFFSFAIRNKLIVASSDAEIQAMLDNGGKVTGSGGHRGAMFVLTADKAFLQAGLKTDDMADEDGGWESNIIRNTEQVALLISESKDLIAIEAQLVSADPRMAESIGGIVNGLISLQAFNSELDPDIRTLIQNTKIQVTEKVLSISTIIEPKRILQVLDN